MDTTRKKAEQSKFYRVVGAAIIVPLSLMFVFHSVARSLPDLGFNSGGFGDIANWLQALVALWAVAVTAVAAIQIFEVKKQTEIQQRRAETEAYRPLISAHMQSIKRFVNFEEIGTELEKLDATLTALRDPQKQQLQGLLEELRVAIAHKAKFIELPLLGRDASLDDIESLLNEYNYLCKQLLDETIERRFATEMAMVNFERMYERLAPFLRLRRLMSPKYASHFHDYVAEGKKQSTPFVCSS